MNDPRHPTRRELLTLAVGAFVIAAVPLTARRERRLMRRSAPVMGTVAELAVVHRDERFAQLAMDAAMGELWAVEQQMSRFDPASDVGRTNRAPVGSAVPVSAATAKVLERALHWAAASAGRFDPCVGRAVELWDVTRRTTPPAAAQLQRLAARDLYRALRLEPARDGAARVSIEDADAAIDLGGIAKGYGVDRAVAVLRDWGIENAFVNVGGDLYALGRSADGDPWNVGVRSPADPQALSTTLELEDAAVATSGDYEQFFTFAGRRYHHILDPATAEPRLSPAHSVTVKASCCMDADAAATALFGATPETAARTLRMGATDARVVNTG